MSRSKHWVFTLNNFSEDDEQRIAELHEKGKCAYVLYGRETGESGTPHLQGFVSFSERKRFACVKACIGGNPHVEAARNVEKACDYCRKDGDFVEFGEPPVGQGSRSDIDAFKDDVKGGMLSLKGIREKHSAVYARYSRFCLEYVYDNLPEVVIENHELRSWQRDLKELLDGEADDRSIVFVVDLNGNTGKTWFAHWYSATNEKCQVLVPGKKTDMSYALNVDLKVVFMDAPRSKQGEYIQYDFLEELKNGYVFSTKYESRYKKFERLHVVVMMNEQPDFTKLSEDRYKIIEP